MMLWTTLSDENTKLIRLMLWIAELTMDQVCKHNLHVEASFHEVESARIHPKIFPFLLLCEFILLKIPSIMVADMSSRYTVEMLQFIPNLKSQMTFAYMRTVININ